MENCINNTESRITTSCFFCGLSIFLFGGIREGIETSWHYTAQWLSRKLASCSGRCPVLSLYGHWDTPQMCQQNEAKLSFISQSDQLAVFVEQKTRRAYAITLCLASIISNENNVVGLSRLNFFKGLCRHVLHCELD